MAEENLVFNPSYVANRARYARHRDWVESDPEVLATYLYMTEMEANDTVAYEGYLERQKFLDTDNDIEPLLTIHYADLTKDVFNVTGFDVAAAEDIQNDIDAEGHSAWSLTKDVFWELLWAGFVAVETHSPGNPSNNARDAKARAERSYSRVLDPDSVVEWERFTDDGPRKGQLRLVTLRRETVTVQEGKESKEYQIYKRYWFNSQADAGYSCQRFRSVKPVDELKEASEVQIEPYEALETGELPVIPVTFFGNPDAGIKDTVIYRAVWQSIILLNKQSFYDKTGRYQGSEKHILATDSLQEQDAVAVASNTMGIITDPEAKLHTLAASDPIANWRDIQRLRQSIKHQVLLQSNQAVNPESREQPSVESKRADHEARKNFYNELTDVVQQGMGTVLAIHARFEDRTTGASAEIVVEFKRDFQLKDFEMEQTEEASLLSLAGQLGKAGVKIKKQVAVNRVMTMRIVEHSGQKDSEIRQELIDAVLAEEETPIQSGLGASILQRRLVRGNGGRAFGKQAADEA